MALFGSFGIEYVPHYSPLHYLPFIARARALKSKPVLRAEGYDHSHFRTKSRRQDVARGFGEYVFLTLDAGPRIVRAKLRGGFPHIEIAVPSTAIESIDFALCRYNIAMTRVLKRDGKPGRPESDTNGRYYGTKQIPIAQTMSDKEALLKKHFGRDMIEVLVPYQLPLPDDTRIVCYSDEDAILTKRVVSSVNSPWQVHTLPPPGPYNRNKEYFEAVTAFVDRALDHADWRGDGLEFDRV